MGYFSPHDTSGSKGSGGPQNLTQYYLPNGLSINNRREDYSYNSESVVATALSDLRPSKSLTFRDATTLLFSTTILRVPDSSYPVDAIWPDSGLVIEAAECGIYLCVKEFQSKVQDGVFVEESREISSIRDPHSFNPSLSRECGGYCDSFDFRVSTKVDALFANETYFRRTDLSIEVPTSHQSSNELKRVNVSQASIDSLSSYVWSLFDEGMFKNGSIDVTGYGPCSDDGA